MPRCWTSHRSAPARSGGRRGRDPIPIPILAPTLYRLGDTLDAWAAEVLELAGAGPFLVVGNSVGGSCAFEMARLAPGQVRGMVLVGAKAPLASDRGPSSRSPVLANYVGLERPVELVGIIASALS